MSSKIIGAILRTLLAGVAGRFALSGFDVSDSEIDQISGAAAVVLTGVWSIWQKIQAHRSAVDAAVTARRAGALLLFVLFVPAAAAAQTVCPQPCAVQRGEAFTIQWDTNATAPGAGPVAEYRLYMGIQGGTPPVVIQRVAVGSPQIANGVINFSNPAGTTAPDNTYVLLVGAANGITDTAVETRSDPVTLVVKGALTAAPPKPTGGRILKP